MPQDNMNLLGIEKTMKTFKTKTFPNIEFVAGTANKKALKAAFLEVRGNVKSLSEENHTKKLSFLGTQIRWTAEKFLKLNSELYLSHIIMVKDIPESFEDTGKTFTKFEITVFPKRETSIEELTDSLNELSKYIYESNIKYNNLFEFKRKGTK